MMCDHPPIPAKIVAPHSSRPFSNLRRPYAGVVAFVDPHGKVTMAWLELSSGSKEYDQAAIAAIKLWTWIPAAAHCTAMDGASEFTVGGSDYTFTDPCNHDAVATLSQPPKFSPLDLQANVPLHTEVAVTVDQFGEVLKTAVKHPSGSRSADTAVTQAALGSNYFPAVHACMPQATDYVFTGEILP